MKKSFINNINIDVTLVQRLISMQFPEWVDLPIQPVQSSGWDNRTFYLGEHMVVRLPSSAYYAEQVIKEQHWQPVDQKWTPFITFAILLHNLKPFLLLGYHQFQDKKAH